MDKLERQKTLLEMDKVIAHIHDDIKELNSEILLDFSDYNYYEDHKDSLRYGIIASSAILMSICKENIIDKVNDESNLCIDQEYFNGVISKIIKINEDNTASIGGINFSNSTEAFEFIRNKLLHGDYCIEEDNIRVDKEGIEATFNCIDLSDMVLDIQQYTEDITKSKKVILVASNGNEKTPMKIKIENGIIEYVELYISKKGKRKLDYKDMKLYTDFIDEFKCLIQFAHKDIDIVYKHLMSKYGEQFAERKINIKCEINKLVDNPNYSKIVKVFNENENIYDGMDVKNISKNDYRMLCQIVECLIDENKDVSLTTEAIKNYIIMLKKFINDEFGYFRSEEFYLDEKGYLKYNNTYTYGDDIVLASGIIRFYTFYQYGLDDILSNRKKTSLRAILKHEKLDFSKIDLTIFEDPDMVMELEINDSEGQIRSLRKEHQKTVDEYEDKKTQYENYKANPNHEEERLELIKKNYDIWNNKKTQEEEMLEYYSTFDVEEYEKNLNIVNHIRNAIAHGGVTFKPYEGGDTLNDRKIVIQDIYEGKMTYQKEVVYRDFFTLFNARNTSELAEHFEISAKDAISDLTIKKYETAINDGEGLIISEKKEEWKEFFLKSIDDNTIERPEYLDIAYVHMHMLVHQEEFSVIQFVSSYKFYMSMINKMHTDGVENQRNIVTFDMLKCFEKTLYYIMKYAKYVPEDLRYYYVNSKETLMSLIDDNIENTISR